MTLTLRSARPADLPALAALHQESWRQTYPGMLSAAALGAPLEAMMAAKWRPEILDRAEICLAEMDGALAGFLLWEPDHPDGPYLDNFHTAPAFRGQGVGHALMAALLRDLAGRGATRLWLIVLEGNAQTRAVYRHWGGVEGPGFADPILGETPRARRVIWQDLAPLAARFGVPWPSNPGPV